MIRVIGASNIGQEKRVIPVFRERRTGVLYWYPVEIVGYIQPVSAAIPRRVFFP